MSWVTHVMLHISPMEEEPDALIAGVNGFFDHVAHPVTGAVRREEGLASMSSFPVPGGKGFSAQVWVGAYNYLPVDAFVAHVQSLAWDAGGFSRLFVQDAEDLSFRVIALGAG